MWTLTSSQSKPEQRKNKANIFTSLPQALTMASISWCNKKHGSINKKVPHYKYHTRWLMADAMRESVDSNTSTQSTTVFHLIFACSFFSVLFF